ncbi:MAG: glycosyltransferase [Elusimicrobia bacterium]|nr:MAG: glycosyltransferase [Elusimicrobiota bacterium]
MSEERAPRAVAAAAVLASSAVLTWFLRANRYPPGFDEAWYLEVSYRFFHTLANDGPLALAQAWAAAFRFKAPLISALPLPLYAVFGPSYDSAVLANIPALALLGASLYGLGRRFFSPGAGALAAALGLAMPLTATLARTFFVETWLTAFSAAFLWRLAESDQCRKDREAPLLGLLFGLGLLTKVLFPGVVAAPVAWVLWQRAHDPRGPSWPSLERWMKVFAAVALGTSLTWYGPNLVYVTGFALSAYRGGIGAHYGAPTAWGVPQVTGYLVGMANGVLSWYTVLLLLALLLFLRRRLLGSPGLLFAAAWVVPYLLLTTSGLCKDHRYIAPAVPGVALALAGLLDAATAGRKYRVLVLCLAFLPLAGDFLLQAFSNTLPPAVAAPLARLFPTRTQYGGPPRPEGTVDSEAILLALASHLPPASVVAAGIEHPRLNANLLAAAAAKNDLPLAFIHYGHMEGELRRVLIRFIEKDATHILFLDGLPEEELPPMIPKVDAELRAHVREGRLPFRKAASFRFSHHVSGELWERTGPIRMAL